MRTLIIALMLMGSFMASGRAFSDDSDTAWVNQCIKDNKREGQTTATVKIYCECMNGKMSDDETQSITQWEKSHPKEMKECDARAGWK
ncbi:MAG: hypothetical protein HQL03_07765 [Nitrospirae bacterium]|nr:hypothetical protein [Nitrospirota bacterium]MBF0591932.1 hypothetical protein [Nitrospirota bacterium]